MRRSVLLICCVVYGIVLLAQSSERGRIAVQIKTEQASAIENSTVELIRAKDSSLVKIAITDKNGEAEFENIPFGSYRVRAGGLHFSAGYSDPVELFAAQPFVKLPVMILHPQTAEIGGVTVTARKPFIQRLTDRIVVNVENSIISAGSSAMDVLERSPGVRVGQNDAISLAGKPGVIIMINGKIVPMNGEELGNYLRSLPSSTIERIDIISNPSARYDAAGNAGIIDIRMKKDQKLGANGTVTAGYGQGVYPKANAGGTFNYRSKKISLYGNLNYSNAIYYNNIDTRRYFFQNNEYTGSYDQFNKIKRTISSYLLRLGVDYTINEKTLVGVLFTGSRYLTDREGDNESSVLDRDNIKSSSFLTSADGKENYKNYLVNLNLRHRFDSTGRELTADLDIGEYNREWASYFSTGYFNAAGQPSQPLFLALADQQGFTGLNILKADYTHPLRNKAKMDLGFKTSFVRSVNDVLFFDRSNGVNELDSSQSNSFKYRENINAVYINYYKEWKKLSLQAGLRAEYTDIMTYQIFDKIKMDSAYLKLFPSVFLNYKIKEEQSLGVSVSRRIDRPAYGQLNPFRIFVDPSFFAAGDPQLKPAFTWSYELSYTRKQFNMALTYSHTLHPLTTVLIPSETQDRVTIQTTVNLASFDFYGFNFSAPLRISKWWSMINNGNIYLRRNRGYIAQTVIDNKTVNGYFSSNHQLTIGKGWTGELNFLFDSGNNTGVMKDQFYWILGAGIQKILFAGKGTIRLNVTDILWRQWPRFRSIYTNYHEYVRVYRDTRVANISFTYRFGKNTVTQARRRTTASEEERRRAGN